KKENKLIFLSIGYSSCYWCHVMERKCFENVEVAKLMNAGFICIKVDREERPDIDAIYMAALHATGRQGGWPLSMFLTPDGKPIGGGTYFPPEDRGFEDGKAYGFKSILRLINEDWQKHPDVMQKQADRVADMVKQEMASAGIRFTASQLNRALVNEVVEAVK